MMLSLFGVTLKLVFITCDVVLVTVNIEFDAYLEPLLS